mgnify:CR=1 FL=1
MPLLYVLQLVALAVFAFMLGLYLVEAWRLDKRQAVLCLIPFYVFYFAFVKSERPFAFRLALVLATALLLAPVPQLDTDEAAPEGTTQTEGRP